MGLLKRKPKFQLTGLGATEDGLYDGSFISACALWWNHLLDERAELLRLGHRPLSADEVARLAQVPLPEGRRAFEVIAAHVAMQGRQSNAVVSLAYAFAVVLEAAAAQTDDDASGAEWERPAALTPDDLIELEKHYSQEGWAREIDRWNPYWHFARTLFPEKIGDKVVESLARAFDDQVDRWSAAEGFDLRRSIGSPDYALVSAEPLDAPVRLPNFVDLLFEWGGRLRLAERLITEGHNLKDLRFVADPLNPIDFFYAEAYERYAALAEPSIPPISPDVERAVRTCLAWLGEDLDERGRLGVSTAAIRGYLWRKAEQTAGSFLEPELSEAVERSRTIGEDRSSDEAFSITLTYAALQCAIDGVNLRFGSVGGLLQGQRSFERAMLDTTDDFEEQGIVLDEKTLREAWGYGVAVFEVERVLTRAGSPEPLETL